jgi:uncharacterized protein DUF4262
MRVATDKSEQKVISDVQEHGWHVILVSPDESGPGFAFTIGLFHSYGHSEVILFGLPDKVAHSVLNLIGAGVKGGLQLHDGDRSRHFLERHECAFVAFPVTAYHDYLGYARWFYSGDGFPVLQCVWPDANGRFPWEPAAREGSKELQPVPGHLGATGST